MCFSPHISATFAVIGAFMTTYAYALRRDPKHRYTYLILAFYTGMEILQTVQYFWVNQCDSKMNVFLTNVAYVYVIIQPMLWNMWMYTRSKTCQDKNVFKLAIVLCLLWVIWSVLLRISYDPQKHAEFAKCDALTAEQTCTKRDGMKHLYWQWTSANIPGYNANMFMYFALWIIPALLTGQYMIGIFVAISVVIASFIVSVYNGNRNEVATVWCITSVPALLLALFVQ